MISKSLALTADHFHYGTCVRTVGPRGGVKTQIIKCRRNGSTQTWKYDQNRFRVPIKRGLYEYGEITQDNAGSFHAASDCPLNIAESVTVE